MVAAIKQTVTVQPGGVVEIRSPDLKEGTQAEVIVLVEQPAGADSPRPRGGWRQFSGAIDSGDPHSSDNERIDADLAREYGSTHEPDK